jgi:plasmid stability protein
MNERHRNQYTIRGVPETIDSVVRERAQKYGKSMNAVALEALERGLGLTAESPRFHDLDHLAGTWVKDEAFDRAIDEMDVVDEELWS